MPGHDAASEQPTPVSPAARERQLRTWTGNLFVGRDELRNHLVATLEDAPLVTLLGTGGVGKTRLAIEVALAERADAESGAPPVDYAVALLAEIQDEQGMLREIVSALGIVDHQHDDLVEVIVKHVAGRELLLVLDNCEHLIDSVGGLIGILLAETRDSGGLRVLATSRHSLNVPGEQVFPVPPLRLPQDDDIEQERRTPSAGLQLLLDRVQQRRGRPFGPEDDWNAIVDLVAWAGGLPLILELMAAWLAGMAPRDLLTRLETRRIALTARTGTQPHTQRSPRTGRVAPPHHRALETMLNWSADLCQEPERRLWARISIFTGGFSLEAAEEVCSGPGIDRDDVPGLLADLVDKSLVTLHTDTGRYSQLQPVRKYGQDMLQRLGETDELRARHFDYFECLAERAAAHWFGPDEVVRWLSSLGAEVGNIRAALQYCRSLGSVRLVERGCLLATNVARARAPVFHSWLGEWATGLEQLLDMLPSEPSDARIAGSAMVAWLRLCQGLPEQAKVRLDHCQELTRSAGIPDPPPVVFASGAYLLVARGDPRFLDVLTRAAAMLDGVDGFAGDRHMVLLIRALGAAMLGLDEADACAQICMRDAEENQAEWAVSWAQWVTGLVLLAEGKPYAATARIQDALATQIAFGDRWGAMWSVEAICWAIAAMLPSEPAERLFAKAAWLAILLGGAIGLQEATGVKNSGLLPFKQLRDKAIAIVLHYLHVAVSGGARPAGSRSMAPQEAYARGFAKGTALDSRAVYSLALTPQPRGQTSAIPVLPMPPDVTMNALTRREKQIAVRVAQGASNRIIADELGLKTRTIESNLRNIYVKLGLGLEQSNPRAGLSAWVARQQAGTESATDVSRS